MPYRHALNRVLSYLCLLLVSLPGIAADALPKGLLVLDGRAAPPLVLDDMDGERWDIGEASGRWLFVHFWATWCGPCREEMPTIQAIVPKIDPARLEIVLVNTAETEDTVFAFLADVAPDLTPLMDTDGLVTEHWQPRGLPVTFFVDPQGRLQYLALGGRPWDTPPYLEFLRGLVRH
jgi:thiol-disulfide isomerase/thioredoxin